MSTVLLTFVGTLICGQGVIQNSQLTDGSNEFGYDLSNELYSDSTTNLWISPFCISSCFALIYPGTAGDTQTQIANILNFPTTTSNPGDVTQQYFNLQSLIESTYDGKSEEGTWDKPSIIGIANKIYISNLITPKQTYINTLSNTITQQSFIEENFDFTSNDATIIINQWVNDNTNGLINNIVDENQDISNWRLVALNAIYLNGSFASPFKKYMTSSQKFYINGLRIEQHSDIYLMHQQDYFGYYNDGNYQFLKFPFSDSADLFVLFALPINIHLYTQRNGLITDQNLIKTAVNNLQSTYIALALPKLSIVANYELNKPLQTMGMTNAFIDGVADFSNIADVQLFIDTVIHKTMIKMDENGLMAAAVTAIAVGGTGIQIPPKAVLFKADHPFQIFIIDGKHDNTILFMGQINDPGIPQGSDIPNYIEPTDSIWNDFSLYTDNTNAPTSTIDGTTSSQQTMDDNTVTTSTTKSSVSEIQPSPLGTASGKCSMIAIFFVIVLAICF